MIDFIQFIARHREAVVFLYVFADQIGIPIPAVPALLAMGAFAAAGKLDFGLMLLLCVAASLLADVIWYTLGRKRGADVLRLLCTISLEPDSCVRRTENVFLRYGVRSLLITKFVPGLNAIAPPLAGIVGVGVARFVAYSIGAALLWAGAWSAIGYLAGDALQQVLNESGPLGMAVGWTLAAIIVVYIAVKWTLRQRFLRTLRAARISQDELKQALDLAAPVVIIDLRSALDVTATPFVIPGALRIAAEELEQRHHDIPRDQDIVLYCS